MLHAGGEGSEQAARMNWVSWLNMLRNFEKVRFNKQLTKKLTIATVSCCNSLTIETNENDFI